MLPVEIPEFFCGQFLSIGPKITEWQHLEVINDCVFKIEGEIFPTLLNVPQICLSTADSGSHIGLRLASERS